MSTKSPGKTAFDAYNNAGGCPGLTWDKKPVPTWENLTDDVRDKWVAGEKMAGRARLDAFGLPPRGDMVEAFARALIRYDTECAANNSELSLRILLECFEDELQKMRDGERG